MNEVQQLAAALAEHDAFERFRLTRPDLPQPERQQVRLARLLKVELLNAAVLIAAAASLANAIDAGGDRAPSAHALAVYVPAPSAAFQASLDRLVGEEVDAELCFHLQGYAARLSLAQRMSTAFADDPARRASVQPVDPEILADAWRRACAAARAAIEALAALEAGPAHPTALEQLRTIELLRLAEAGDWPCLDPDGRITIPGWAERRREKRHELRQDATARFGTTIVPVLIRDASRSGLGLEMRREARPGERLVVTLPGGPEFAGEVAWWDKGRAGIKLDRWLSAEDPLIARSASRAARLKPEPSA
jgi:hypothetical protein